MKLSGLSSSEVQAQLEKFGYNEIPTKKEFRGLKIFLSQFNSFLTILLIFAGGISIFLKETVDGIAILAIVIINAIIGFIQEYKAENAVKKLSNLVVPRTIVIRDGEEKEIPVRELVPGDILILSEGDKIPADLELIENFSLQVDEAILTGESQPVLKALADKLFKGTLITSGRGLAKVLSTGQNTEFGKIVALLNENQKHKSPLAKQLDQLGKKIGLFTLGLISILFLLGFLRKIPLFEMLMTTVALGVSAIPEGLPIIVTLTLASGVQILARKNAIVRKMTAIETLGATTVICSDKTGTLTLNEMTVKTIFVNNEEKDIPGQGYKIEDKIEIQNPEETLLMEISENCNNAFVGKHYLGDPTEIALKVLSLKTGTTKIYEKLDEKVFTSDRKMMSTYHQKGGTKVLFAKGAFEEILKKSSHIAKNGEIHRLDSAEKNLITKQALKYSTKALRVLGLAYRTGEFKEEQLIFVGLVAMIDPPRKTVAMSLKIAREAGIKVKIITGDNAITAKAIGEKIGMQITSVATGDEIDKLNDEDLLKLIRKTEIFARTKPEHKYRIVDLLQKDHEVVAVTGDGVNDAPALKHADVGIAMGIKGTEATKEVADIVLKDDNFSTIVTTIEEGRRIYNNILSFIKYMLSANFITILLVAVITIGNYPLPILALQVLWLNVATDALPALALGRSPAAPNIMQQKPHPKKENILYKFLGFIIIAAVVQVGVNILIYIYGLHLDQQAGIITANLDTPSYARTLVFTQTVMFELFFAFVCKQGKNRYLIAAVAISFLAHSIILYFPPAQAIFKTIPLEPFHWLIVIIGAASAFIIPKLNQVGKWLFSR